MESLWIQCKILHSIFLWFREREVLPKPISYLQKFILTSRCIHVYENFDFCRTFMCDSGSACNRRVHPDSSVSTDTYTFANDCPNRNTNCSSDTCLYNPGSRTNNNCPSHFPPDNHQRHASALYHLIPEGYTGTSIRVISTGYTNDYKTTIYNPATQGSSQIIDDQSGNYSELADSLTIFSYSTSLDVSQNLRAFLRNSGTVFDESTVTSLNGITYTRFDTRTDPFTGTPDETVIYVGNQANANQKGYLPEMIYSVTPGGIINRGTYENMIMSFQYYPSKTIGTAPGTETDKPTYYQ